MSLNRVAGVWQWINLIRDKTTCARKRGDLPE
jgi:hypothetical protein